MYMAKNLHKNNKYGLLVLLSVVFLLSGFGCNSKDNVEKETMTGKMELGEFVGDMQTKEKMEESTVSTDKMMKKFNGTETGMMMTKTDYQYEGFLEDVSGGNASGVAKASFEDGTYKLLASFSDLPPLEKDYFYEGWVVRKNPFDFISTGAAKNMGGIYNNLYQSDQNLTDYDFYVLTLEPDDGDPAPAAHIVEGTMKKK